MTLTRRFFVKALLLGFLPTLLLCFALRCEMLPRSYGICIICHARDAVNLLLDAALGTHYLTYGPFLTPLGVVVGSLLSSKGRRWGKGGSMVKFFIYGFSVALGASLVGMCPFRITTLVAWFSLPALIALVGFVGGVLLCLKSKSC